MIELPEKRVDRLIDEVIAIEGGYVKDNADRGGETCYGITVAVARAAGYAGPMQDMPKSVAQAIYRRQYVTAPAFDQVLTIDPSIGAELVDTGVNMGPTVAASFLQRWLNGFNVDGTRYAVLTTDGKIGPVTLRALRAYIQWRGPMGVTALLRGLNASQGAKYLGITESDSTQRRFLFGWVTNRVEI